MQKNSKKFVNLQVNLTNLISLFETFKDKIRKTHRSIEQYLVNNTPLNEKILISSREEILKPLRDVRSS